jgi:hypothetical protein
MKSIMFLALSLTASVSAYAVEASPTPAVAHYQYGMQLDIAHVVKTTPVANVCGPTPVQMTYNDSHGGTHTLEYDIFGNGCTN